MYIARLIKNKSELLGSAYGTPCFHVPIQLIEFKLNAESLDIALHLARSKLEGFINCYDEVRIDQQTGEYLLFSFGNIRDGLTVTYEIRAF
ncbi:hypothetical protein QMK38_15935 [Lysinibacillus fusiformis]|uniref:hypothetical protein n=1 Tax=Ureibacillus chungkukjangi TaxID=1202712 RepID=UPI000D36EA6F|nr:hypothetical protein [Ureibacillus chungkukjangi]MCM3389327.1 hypothetical protein [Ureibacillus chungkukjangi]MDI7743493.1 hypothetical protein [Lysinibacillus fusiformis]